MAMEAGSHMSVKELQLLEAWQKGLSHRQRLGHRQRLSYRQRLSHRQGLSHRQRLGQAHSQAASLASDPYDNHMTII